MIVSLIGFIARSGDESPDELGRVAELGAEESRPIFSNSSGAPVVRKRWWASPDCRIRSVATSILYTSFAHSSALLTQGDLVAHHVGDDARQQRVVRAAEDQRVDVGRDQRVEVLVRDADQLVAARDPCLDEVDEPRADPGREA